MKYAIVTLTPSLQAVAFTSDYTQASTLAGNKFRAMYVSEYKELKGLQGGYIMDDLSKYTGYSDDLDQFSDTYNGIKDYSNNDNK